MESHLKCLDLTFNADSTSSESNLVLVGKLISHKIINPKAITYVLLSTWNLGPNVQVSPTDKNMVTCTFQNAKDRQKIAESGLWSVKGSILNLKRWDPNLTYSEIDFSTCTLWVQIHNLPPNR